MLGSNEFLTVKFEFYHFRAPHLPVPDAAFHVFSDEDDNRDIVLVYNRDAETIMEAAA